MTRERLHRHERACDVHVENAAPVLDRHLQDRRIRVGGRVVDEHVDAAEALGHGRDCARSDLGIRDVADDRGDVVAARERRRRLEVEDADARTFLEKRACDRAAEAVRPAGDERNTAGESRCHRVAILTAAPLPRRLTRD